MLHARQAFARAAVSAVAIIFSTETFRSQAGDIPDRMLSIPEQLTFAIRHVVAMSLRGRLPACLSATFKARAIVGAADRVFPLLRMPITDQAAAQIVTPIPGVPCKA